MLEANDGDPESMRAWMLLDTTRTRLIGFARRFLGELQEAEDVVQETLVRAGVALPRLRSRDRLEAWLFRICRHAAIDRVRARRVRKDIWGSLPEELEPSAAPEPEPPRQLPAELLDRLPPHQRLLLHLHHDRGLSQARLCALSGLSAPALRVRLYRARQRLRGAIKLGGCLSR